MYTNDAANTDFMATGVLSWRTQKTSVNETFKFKGTQDASKVYQSSNYFWNCTEAGTNNSTTAVTADWFVSTDTKMNYDTHVYAAIPVTRNSDNTINMNGLLVLTANAKAGAVVGGQASAKIDLSGKMTGGLLFQKTTGSGSVETGDMANMMLYILLLLGAAGVYAVSKKRKHA